MNLTRKIKFSDGLPFELEVKIVLIVTWSGESIGTMLLKGGAGCKEANYNNQRRKRSKIWINSLCRQEKVFVYYTTHKFFDWFFSALLPKRMMVDFLHRAYLT
jgi:hypothetical protein